MIWHDLFVDRWVDARELKQAALAAFGVPVHHIEVTEDVPRGEAAHHERHLLLRRMRQSRDFPLQLLVVILDDRLARGALEPHRALAAVRAFAAALNASVTYGADDLSDSEWLRVRPTGELSIVTLDTDDDVDVDSFFVVDERPYRDQDSTVHRAAAPASTS